MPLRPFRQVLNRVEFLVENPCAASWSVYIETAVPAAGEAILVLLTPSPKEILEEFLHPGPGRKSPKRLKGKGAHRARSRARTKAERFAAKAFAAERAFTPAIPDTDEVIAHAIPGRGYFAKRIPGKLEGLMWTGIDIADRLAWWWLLITTTEDFIYNWSSGIMESRFCSEGYWYQYQGDFVQAGSTGWRYLNNLNMEPTTGIRCFMGSDSFKIGPPGNVNGYFIITMTVSQGATAVHDNEVGWRLVPPGKAPVYTSSTVHVNKGESVTFSGEAYITDWHNLRVESTQMYPGSRIESCHFEAFGFQAP
jgi:hypothetical protein